MKSEKLKIYLSTIALVFISTLAQAEDITTINTQRDICENNIPKVWQNQCLEMVINAQFPILSIRLYKLQNLGVENESTSFTDFEKSLFPLVQSTLENMNYTCSQERFSNDSSTSAQVIGDKIQKCKLELLKSVEAVILDFEKTFFSKEPPGNQSEIKSPPKIEKTIEPAR